MRTAVYSTLYPQMRRYLCDFLESISSQTDQSFDLWLGLDEVSEAEIPASFALPIRCVAAKNQSIAEFREHMLRQICDQYDAVVLVDSDDVLLPDRVLRAKEALQITDVYACAMRLIDRAGVDLNLVFDYHHSGSWERNLSWQNVVGFSNSAYRTAILKCCFPFPADVVLVDWLTVSLAFGHGATIRFDRTPQMLYRQYAENTAAVVPPFNGVRILKSARLVSDHYRFVLDSMASGRIRHDAFRKQLEQRQLEIEQFEVSMQDDQKLRRYTDSINQINDVFCWWEMIAHPSLESLWT